jgi:hypothetical protein
MSTHEYSRHFLAWVRHEYYPLGTSTRVSLFYFSIQNSSLTNSSILFNFNKWLIQDCIIFFIHLKQRESLRINYSIYSRLKMTFLLHFLINNVIDIWKKNFYSSYFQRFFSSWKESLSQSFQKVFAMLQTTLTVLSRMWYNCKRPSGKQKKNFFSQVFILFVSFLIALPRDVFQQRTFWWRRH